MRFEQTADLLTMNYNKYLLVNQQVCFAHLCFWHHGIFEWGTNFQHLVTQKNYCDSCKGFLPKKSIKSPDSQEFVSEIDIFRK